ncbi:MAG TPA: HNH endonuclease signature motif containing protein [Gemmataceae bacterium]|nr:HNH endonuclease signature motif containing protein [Gemmataceae bacterium]
MTAHCLPFPVMRDAREPVEEVCGLCGRSVPNRLITLHHLKPKQKGGKAEDRTPLCRPCHKQLHATYSNTDLARVYPTLDALRKAPELQPFLKWIRKQKADRNFRTIMSNDHPRRGRRR